MILIISFKLMSLLSIGKLFCVRIIFMYVNESKKMQNKYLRIFCFRIIHLHLHWLLYKDAKIKYMNTFKWCFEKIYCRGNFPIYFILFTICFFSDISHFIFSWIKLFCHKEIDLYKCNVVFLSEQMGAFIIQYESQTPKESTPYVNVSLCIHMNLMQNLQVTI